MKDDTMLDGSGSAACTRSRSPIVVVLLVCVLVLVLVAGAGSARAALLGNNGRIAFASDGDGNREIYHAAADGADPVRLTFDPAADYQPHFFPGGARIAFTSERVWALGRILVMGADGSTPTLLPGSNTSDDHDPSFGTKVAFAGDCVCPPDRACGQILGGGVYVTGSNGLSGRTVAQPGIPLADIDSTVATSAHPQPPPGPVPDTTPPDTQLTSGATGPTNASTSSFAFTGTDDVTATGRLEYSTRLDHGEWTGHSQATCLTLATGDGSHTIAVRARDQAGNQDPTPAERSFAIDTSAPTGTVTIQDDALQRARDRTSRPAPASEAQRQP